MPDIDRAFEVDEGILLGTPETGQASISADLSTPAFSANDGSLHLTNSDLWVRELGFWKKLSESADGYIARTWFDQRRNQYLTSSRSYVTIPTIAVNVPIGDYVALVMSQVSVNSNNATVQFAVSDNGGIISETEITAFLETSNKPNLVQILYGWHKAVAGDVTLMAYSDKNTLKVQHAELLILGAALL